jgi:excisionase family DNA binding protein
MSDLTGELLAALVAASEERKRSALRVLRGFVPGFTEAPTANMRIGSGAAAQYLGITLRELKEIRRRRRLAFYRIGHRTVSFSVADLNKFLASCRVAPYGEAIGAGWRDV